MTAVDVVVAQQNKLDSLEHLLSAAKDKKEKINLFNTLANESRTFNASRSLHYAEEALALATQLRDTLQMSMAIINLGHVHYNEGEYEQAMRNYMKASGLLEKINNQSEYAYTLMLIGNVFSSQLQPDKTLEYYILALKIKNELKDSLGMAKIYANIGNVFYHFKKEADKALAYYLKALQIFEILKHQKFRAMTMHNMGIIYTIQKDYPLALKYLLEANSILYSLQDHKGTSETYLSIAALYVDKQQYQQALEYFYNSIEAAAKINARPLMRNTYEALASAYAKMNNFPKAYEIHHLYTQLKDSLFNEESSRQIADMQTKYETEKKEQQIKLLNKDKEIQHSELRMQKIVSRSMMGGLLVVLLFSVVLINRFLFIRRQKKVIETEREKSEKLLLNILPKEIAEELKRNTTSPPTPLLRERGEVSGGTPPPSGEVGRGWLVQPKRYEQVTIMFTDFKGFTNIAEQMSAEELVSELDYVFKKFDEIISKYPIEKIKTIGDSYMCAGGLPVANTTNPMDVVLAALEICEWMKSRQTAAADGSKTPILPTATANWQLRIGIHTGPVIAGVVGDKKFAYDIWGDTVNIASRMESSGEAGKVNISGDTYQILQNAECRIKNSELEFQYRGEIEAKNKGKIKMYFVE